jgi:hypothetical protein
MMIRSASSSPARRQRGLLEDGETGASVFVRSASAGADALTPSDRRQFLRVAALHVPSVFFQGVSARLLDLGLGGALVESAARPVPGAITSLRLGVRDVKLHARARVRRAAVTGFVRTPEGDVAPLYRSGLEFHSLSPADAHAVRAVLSGAEASRLENAPGRAGLPTLVSVRFPVGWITTERKDTIVARKPQAASFMFLRAMPDSPAADLCEIAEVTMAEAGFRTLDCRPAVINRLSACLGFYHGCQREMGEVIAEAAVVACDRKMYLVAGVAPWVAFEAVRHEFFAAIQSLEQRRTDEATSPAEESADRNRRQHIRCAGPFDGRRAGLLETPIRIYDLSEGGCFINALHTTTSAGQRLEFKIQLPFEGWINVRAVALYDRADFGFAVQFVDLAEHTRERIARTIKKLQALRR